MKRDKNFEEKLSNLNSKFFGKKTFYFYFYFIPVLTIRKLKYFFLLSPGCTGTAEACQSGAHYGAPHSEGRLLALSVNVRQGCKS